jgi:hypothetical protein
MDITSLDTALLVFTGSDPAIGVEVPPLTASGALTFTGSAQLSAIGASGWVSDFGYATNTGATSGLVSSGFWDPVISSVVESGVREAEEDGWVKPYITATVPGSQYASDSTTGFQAGYAEIEADFLSSAAAEYQAHKFEITLFKQDNLIPRDAAYMNAALLYTGNDLTAVERSEDNAVLGATSIKSTLISFGDDAPTPGLNSWNALVAQFPTWADVPNQYASWSDVYNTVATQAPAAEEPVGDDPTSWYGPEPTAFCLAPLSAYQPGADGQPPVLWARGSITTAEARRWALQVRFYDSACNEISRATSSWTVTHGSWLWDTCDFYATQPETAVYATLQPLVEIDDTSYLGESFYFDGARLMFFAGQMAGSDTGYEPARKITIDMEADRVNLARNSAFTHNLSGWQALNNSSGSTMTTLVIDPSVGRTRGGSALCSAQTGQDYEDGDRVGMGTAVGMNPDAIALEVVNPGYPHTLSVWVLRDEDSDSTPVRLMVRTPKFGSGYGSNLLNDPGFESGIAGWDVTDPTYATLAHDSDTFHDTPGSLRMDVSRNIPQLSVRAAGLMRPTDSSSTWGFSGWVKTPTTSTTAWAILLWLDADGLPLSYTASRPFVTATGNWTQVNLYAPAPEGAYNVAPQIQFANCNAGDAFYVDDVMLIGAQGTGYETLKTETDENIRLGAAANLLVNSGFETGVTGWESYPDPTAGYVTLNSTYGGSTTEGRVRTGSYSAQLTCQTGADEITFSNLTQRIPVTPGETYLLSGWLNTSAADGAARAQLGWMDAQGSVFEDPQAVESPGKSLAADVWVYVSQTVTVPPTASFAFPQFAVNNAGGNDRYSLDDLKLIRIVDNEDNDNVFGPWTRLSLTWTPLPGFQPWVDAWIGPDANDYQMGSMVEFWADDVLFERSEQVGEYFDGGGHDPSYIWEEYDETNELSRSHYYRDRRNIQYRLEEEVPHHIPHGVPFEIRYGQPPVAIAPDNLPIPSRPKPPSNDGPYYLTGVDIGYLGANSAVITWDPIVPPVGSGFDFRVTVSVEQGSTLSRPAEASAAMLRGLNPATDYTVTLGLADAITGTVIQTTDVTFTTAQIMWSAGMTNYAPDPSFEKSAFDEDSGAPTFWSIGTTSAETGLIDNTDIPLDGDHCLEMAARADGLDHPITTYPAREMTAPVAQGDAWTVSGWVRCSVTKPVAVTLSWWSATGFIANSVPTPAYSAAAANTWKRIEHTATAPAGATRVVAEFHINDQVSGETYWLDAVMLTRTRQSVEYGDGDVVDWVWLDDTYYLSQYQGQANPVPVPDDVHTSDVAGHSAVIHWTPPTEE